jgi:ketosteroid isomerase-like protein
MEKMDILNNYNSDNILAVQYLYSAFAKRDIKSILDMLSPDIEWGEPVNPYNPADGS